MGRLPANTTNLRSVEAGEMVTMALQYLFGRQEWILDNLATPITYSTGFMVGLAIHFNGIQRGDDSMTIRTNLHFFAV